MISSTPSVSARLGSRLGLLVSEVNRLLKQLRQMADAFRSCTSYEDAGELHIVPEGGAEEEPQPFAVAFERPNRARIH